MPLHNFRLTGNRYFSKFGNDSRSGSQDEPRRTINDSNLLTGGGDVNIIGAGDYTAGTISANVGRTLRGDGRTIIRNFSMGSGWVGNNNTTSGIIFISSSLLVRGGTISGCIFRNSSLAGTIVTGFLTSCIFLSSSFANVGGWYTNINGSIFISCSGTIIVLNNSYLNSSTNLIYIGTAANFRNNNIQGLIILPVSGGSGYQSYAIQDQFTGEPSDNGYDVSVHWLNEANLTADGYTGTVSGWNTAVNSCMNREPNFNDAEGEDFTLQSNSPHILASTSGASNIGGTPVAQSIINTDHNAENIFVEPSPEIDTSIPLSYILNDGENEGYIDYTFDLGGIAPIAVIRKKAELKFNSDNAGGSTTNNNVPDSEPLTSEYAKKVTTIASGGTTQFILDNSENISIGDWCSILGQKREVSDVEENTPSAGQKRVTVSSAFASTIGSGATVTYGTENQLGALNPNRLTYQLRVSLSSSKPVVESDWDNDLDPSYGEAGTFFTQQWGARPQYRIFSGSVWGAGDSDAPSGATLHDISARWVQIRAYLRNNYSSNGV